MKIHRLETHDRLLHLKKDQSINIFKGAEDCLKKNPLSLAIQEKCPYVYLFAHPRTCEDGVTKAMYWQPRISRPKPETNSYCFRAKSKTDQVTVCWLLPPREMWSEYICGRVTQDDMTVWSINQFRFHFNQLAQPDPEDLSEERGNQVLSQILMEHKQAKEFKPLPSEGFSL